MSSHTLHVKCEKLESLAKMSAMSILKHLYQYSEPTSLLRTVAVHPQPASSLASKLDSTNLTTPLLTVASRIERAAYISTHTPWGGGTGHWSSFSTGSLSSTLHSSTPRHRSIHASQLPPA